MNDKPKIPGFIKHEDVPMEVMVERAAAQAARYEARIANQVQIINRLTRATREATLADISDRFAREENWNAVRRLEQWREEILNEEVKTDE